MLKSIRRTFRSYIIWRAGVAGARWTGIVGPPFWNGGTCWFGNQVLIYPEISGSIRVNGGKVLHKGRYDIEYQDFCPVDDVIGVFNEDGQQLFIFGPPADNS